MNFLDPMTRKLAISITGASGSIYAFQLLKFLAEHDHPFEEIGLVMSSNAKDVWEFELGNKSYESFNFICYDKNDFMAPFASGSAKYTDMVIIPCSMGTLGRIANGISNDLTTRAADVILKERRKLILVARETPLNAIHLKNMTLLTDSGAIICPAVPSFYSRPQSIEEVVNTVVSRVIDLLEIEQDSYRWGNDNK